ARRRGRLHLCGAGAEGMGGGGPGLLLPPSSSLTASTMLQPGVQASPDESGVYQFIIVCKEVKSLYLHFVPHLFTKSVTHQFLCFFFLSQAVDDSGVPGMDRVDSMAEYLVELAPALSGPHQPAGQEYLLSYYFPSVPCHTYSHSCFCLFSRAAVDVSHTTHPGTVAQQEGVEAGQRGGARTGPAQPLVCGD